MIEIGKPFSPAYRERCLHSEELFLLYKRRMKTKKLGRSLVLTEAVSRDMVLKSDVAHLSLVLLLKRLLWACFQYSKRHFPLWPPLSSFNFDEFD